MSTATLTNMRPAERQREVRPELVGLFYPGRGQGWSRTPPAPTPQLPCQVFRSYTDFLINRRKAGETEENVVGSGTAASASSTAVGAESTSPHTSQQPLSYC
ncbi:unnamed protein product [Pylaiella littoralis]